MLHDVDGVVEFGLHGAEGSESFPRLAREGPIEELDATRVGERLEPGYGPAAVALDEGVSAAGLPDVEAVEGCGDPVADGVGREAWRGSALARVWRTNRGPAVRSVAGPGLVVRTRDESIPGMRQSRPISSPMRRCRSISCPASPPSPSCSTRRPGSTRCCCSPAPCRRPGGAPSSPRYVEPFNRGSATFFARLLPIMRRWRQSSHPSWFITVPNPPLSPHPHRSPATAPSAPASRRRPHGPPARRA